MRQEELEALFNDLLYLKMQRIEQLEAALAEAETSRDASKKLAEETLAKLAEALEDGKMMHTALHMWEDVTYPSMQRRIAALEADYRKLLADPDAVRGARILELEAEVARLKALLGHWREAAIVREPARPDAAPWRPLEHCLNHGTDPPVVGCRCVSCRHARRRSK